MIYIYKLALSMVLSAVQLFGFRQAKRTVRCSAKASAAQSSAAPVDLDRATAKELRQSSIASAVPAEWDLPKHLHAGLCEESSSVL